MRENKGDERQRIDMKNKKKVQANSRNNQSLVTRWIVLTLPIITAVIILPYSVIWLYSLYGNAFHIIPRQTILAILSIQGIIVAFTPIVTAWAVLQQVTDQLQMISRLFGRFSGQAEQRLFLSDDWIAIERQEDLLGQTAQRIKAFMIHQQNFTMPQHLDEVYGIPLTDKTAEQGKPYHSIFAVRMQEPETNYLQ
jgi:hypothetical protein